MPGNERIALVLGGGGARAAYQAGVLRALVEICQQAAPCFHLFSGESAGAINAAFLASRAENFPRAAEELWNSWQEIKLDQVFHTNAVGNLTNAMGWLKDISTGGMLGNSKSVYLLNTAPLKTFIEKHIDFQKIEDLIQQRVLHGLAVSATNYATGCAVTFFNSDQTGKSWARNQRIGKRTQIRTEHLMASAAIPILFPPIRIGHTYYGDGSVRLKNPLSPCIHMGATKILAIGSRMYSEPSETVKNNEKKRMNNIALVDIAGVLLNAGFLDNLDMDIELAERINETVSSKLGGKNRVNNQWRNIEILAIRPSKDLGLFAQEEFKQFNYLLRYLMRGLGTSSQSGWDLMSYMAFDSAFTKQLLTLGYMDAKNEAKQIRAFFSISDHKQSLNIPSLR